MPAGAVASADVTKNPLNTPPAPTWVHLPPRQRPKIRSQYPLDTANVVGIENRGFFNGLLVS